ncbi:hypothetical protein LTR17_020945 [Elasticomyces elasticus]|nr:hypothetical protein LTR17_020945 [Elasticomyces elasticus]
MGSSDNARPDPLSRLPPELHLNVFDSLGYDDAFRLQRLNRFYYTLINPAQWSRDKQVGFVKQQQLHHKHNSMQMVIGRATGDRTIVMDTNGFACYHCYRVLPIDHFSIRQTRKHNAKDSPHDLQTPGCGRFCLDCGIKGMHYRYEGTRVRTTVGELYAPDGVRWATKSAKALCTTHAKFYDLDSVVALSCPDCGPTTNEGGDEDFRLHNCYPCAAGCDDWDVNFSINHLYPWLHSYFIGNSICHICSRNAAECLCTRFEFVFWWLSLTCERRVYEKDLRLISTDSLCYSATRVLLERKRALRDSRHSGNCDVWEQEGMENAIERLEADWEGRCSWVSLVRGWIWAG